MKEVRFSQYDMERVDFEDAVAKLYFLENNPPEVDEVVNHEVGEWVADMV